MSKAVSLRSVFENILQPMLLVAPLYLVNFTTAVDTGFDYKLPVPVFLSQWSEELGTSHPCAHIPGQQPSSDDQSQELVWKYLSSLTSVQNISDVHVVHRRIQPQLPSMATYLISCYIFGCLPFPFLYPLLGSPGISSQVKDLKTGFLASGATWDWVDTK